MPELLFLPIICIYPPNPTSAPHRASSFFQSISCHNNPLVSFYDALLPAFELTMASRTRSRSTLRQRSIERPAKLTKSNPSSRSCSPAVGNRRIARLNSYLSRSSRTSISNMISTIEPIPNLPHSREVKRWDGNGRMTMKWDSVRRVCLSLEALHREISNGNRIPNSGSLTATVSSISMNAALQEEVPPYVSRLPTSWPAIAAFFWTNAIAIRPVPKKIRQSPTGHQRRLNTSKNHPLQQSTNYIYRRPAISQEKKLFAITSRPGISSPGFTRDRWLEIASDRPSSPYKNGWTNTDPMPRRIKTACLPTWTIKATPISDTAQIML